MSTTGVPLRIFKNASKRTQKGFKSWQNVRPERNICVCKRYHCNVIKFVGAKFGSFVVSMASSQPSFCINLTKIMYTQFMLWYLLLLSTHDFDRKGCNTKNLLKIRPNCDMLTSFFSADLVFRSLLSTNSNKWKWIIHEINSMMSWVVHVYYVVFAILLRYYDYQNTWYAWALVLVRWIV